MNYYENIKKLIEDNIVLQKTHKLIEETNTLKTYFEVGKNIVEAQGGESRAKYGNELINKWSVNLTKDYGKGFDASNLRRMRQFYLEFQKYASVGHKFSSNITWTHLKHLLPIRDQNKMNYYINMCISNNLSVRKLIELMKSNSYERLSYKGDIEIIANGNSLTIESMLKDPIIIVKNDEVDKLNEKALRNYILNNIEKFLLELGVGFAFIGSEVRLGDWYCDLLFFNTELNSYVIIELKTRKLRSTDIGQIEGYINYVDNNIKKIYHGRTIGVIISKENNAFVMKYCSDKRIYEITYELV